MPKFSLAVVVLIAFTFAAAQQDKSKRPSPAGSTEVTLSGKKVTIDYSRPKIADPKTGQARKIFGRLVSYGQVWRTGANEATSLKSDADLDIGGAKVPAGSYTLFTLPTENGWKLIVNKQTGQWGTKYDEKQDLTRIPMQVAKTSKTVDPFTISFDKKSETEAVLHLAWENTDASVSVKLKK